ncbi:MAG: hypothetical protein WA895_30505 [Streptosporangiaceae bacterium]
MTDPTAPPPGSCCARARVGRAAFSASARRPIAQTRRLRDRFLFALLAKTGMRAMTAMS